MSNKCAEELPTKPMPVSSSTCHIGRLSTEILLEIFRLVNADKAVKKNPVQTWINSDSVSISHVSARWRSIVLDVPSSWGQFDISSDVLSPTPPKNEATSLGLLIDLHLERSKQSPLHIRFVADDTINGNYHAGPSLQKFLQQLLQHSARWKTAVLVLPKMQDLNTVFPESFPSLQELHMRLFTSSTAGEIQCPTFQAPLLRKLDLGKIFSEGIHGSTLLNDVTLTWIMFEAAALYLGDVPPRCHVKIIQLFHTDSRLLDIPTCVSSAVRSLSITSPVDNGEENEGCLGELLDHLALTDIEELEFIDERGWDFPVQELLFMLERSGSSIHKLTHLKLEGSAISDHDLLEILKRLPALTSFASKESEWRRTKPLSSHFFRTLENASQSRPNGLDGLDEKERVIPRLTHLDLHMHSESPPWKELYLFLQSRSEGPVLEALSVARLSVATVHVSTSQWKRVNDKMKADLDNLQCLRILIEFDSCLIS